MKLKDILLESRRTRDIDIKTAESIFQKRCKGFMKMSENDTFIYRHITGFRGDFGWISPSNHTRVSRNTANYYTLLIDNSPSWVRYPKRSKSVICRSDTPLREKRNAHLIIPFDGATLGICPEFDFWESFNIYSMKRFNQKIAYTVKNKTGIVLDKTPDKNEFFNAIKKVSDSNGWLSSYDTYLEELEDFLDPNKNGFSIDTWPSKKIPTDREVWTDKDCLIIRSGEVAFEFLDSMGWSR